MRLVQDHARGRPSRWQAVLRRVHRQELRDLSVAILDAVEFATLTWVDWFNSRRLLQPIGNIPPVEAEERYYALLNELQIAASLGQAASDKPGAVNSARRSICCGGRV